MSLLENYSSSILTAMPLNKLAKEIHQNAVDKGFHETPIPFSESIALMHSELSEALEEARKGRMDTYDIEGKPEGAYIELADCLIRILDVLAVNKINIDELVETKMRYNKTRTYKHGKKF